MTKGKFIYNPNTLRYEKVENDNRKNIVFILLTLVFLTALTAGIYFISVDYLASDHQQKDLIEMHRYYKRMQSEIVMLKNSLENLNERDAAIAKQLMEIDPEEFSYINKGISKDSMQKLSDK